MEVLLLGTGAADGWPSPFCACLSCADARTRGDVRLPTAALLGNHVLIDAGPAVPGAVARAGRS
ncbi:MAG: cobalamin biosynthesis protein CobU, partial [Actinomycetales bacterium mxb001]